MIMRWLTMNLKSEDYDKSVLNNIRFGRPESGQREIINFREHNITNALLIPTSSFSYSVGNVEVW